MQQDVLTDEELLSSQDEFCNIHLIIKHHITDN